MKITIEGNPKEITAVELALKERFTKNEISISTIYSDGFPYKFPFKLKITLHLSGTDKTITRQTAVEIATILGRACEAADKTKIERSRIPQETIDFLEAVGMKWYDSPMMCYSPESLRKYSYDYLINTPPDLLKVMHTVN